jgi:L-asparaginase
MHIHFIATGGTIDKVYFDAKSEYQIGSPQVKKVLGNFQPSFTYAVEQLMAKDSLDLTDEDRTAIHDCVTALNCSHIIITHGTDTMVQTATRLLAIPDKTIVITRAMQPARFQNTDAVFNIGMAIGACSALPPGVYIAMNGAIFDPRRTQKNQAKLCFEEISMDSPIDE